MTANGANLDFEVTIFFNVKHLENGTRELPLFSLQKQTDKKVVSLTVTTESSFYANYVHTSS